MNFSYKFSFFITDGPSCPSEGYIENYGDIIGGGMGSHNVVTVKDCAYLCTNEIDCCVFEFSPNQSDCILYKECIPNNSPYGDYIYCRKSKYIN